MKRRVGAFDIFNLLVLLVLSFSMIYPMWYILINSFTGGAEAMRGGVNWWPASFTTENYRAVFQNSTLLNAFAVSAARTVAASSLHVFFTAMTAYAFSKSYLMGRKLYMRIGLITMLFNGGLIPHFLLINRLHLYDTFWVYVFPAMFSFYNSVIFMSFFRSIPVTIEEAARIDGASDFKTFLRVILPNAKPVLATIALFAAVYHWNDFFMGVVYIKNPKLLPVQTVLFKIVAENSTSAIQQQAQAQFGARISSNAIKYATMVIVVTPIIFLYPFLQKYFVKGMMLGSIKE